MLAKILVLLIFVAILASLGSGLVYLMRDKGKSDRTVKALSLRVGLSVGLFGLLYLLYYFGLIEPTHMR